MRYPSIQIRIGGGLFALPKRYSGTTRIFWTRNCDTCRLQTYRHWTWTIRWADTHRHCWRHFGRTWLQCSTLLSSGKQAECKCANAEIERPRMKNEQNEQLFAVSFYGRRRTDAKKSKSKRECFSCESSMSCATGICAPGRPFCCEQDHPSFTTRINRPK